MSNINYLKMKPLRVIKKRLLILFQAVVLSSLALNLNAGTMHTVGGTVTYSGGGSPSSATFTAYITSRTGEVLTQSSFGCGYGGGSYWVQVGNFPTAWTAGEVLHVELTDGAGGYASGNKTLTNASGEQLNLTIYMPDISISPVSKNYGNVEVGTSSTQGFTVSNTGGATLNVTSTSITGTDASQFSITSGGGSFNLFPGATRTVNVQFHPASAGSKSATLRLASNDPDENPLDAPLIGTGITIPDISASPNPANYGGVLVGSYSDYTIVARNNGTGDLTVSSTTITGTHSGEFNIQSGGSSFTLSPGATRNIVVRFSPSSAGSKNANLQISSNDPDEDPYNVGLNGSGTVPDIDVSPGSRDYGDVEITSSSTETFVVSNAGGATLSVSSTTLTGANAGEFSIISGGGSFTLAPGESRNVNVRFSPASIGAKSATLRFDSNDPDEDPRDISLSGTGIAIPDIAVIPGTKNYGDVIIGSGSSQIFSVSNEGTGNLSVSSSSLTGTHSGEFSITDGGGSFMLTPGSSHNITVSFNPGSAGSKNAVLTIQSNDPDENPVNISLTGNGAEVPVPNIDVDPESHNYGDVNINTGITKTFVVTNFGVADLSVSLVSITGTNSDEFSIISGGGSFTLTQGATRNIVVSFSPVSVGSKSAALHFESDDPDENPYEVELSGNGIVIPDIAISPDSKDYGEVYISSYGSQTFVVTSEGTGELVVSSADITGTDYNEFTITSGGGSFSLSPGSSRNIIVSFNPASTGSKNAILRLVSNDPDENPLDVSLAGDGVDVPVPDINVEPASHDYGNVPVNSGLIETFVISNEGTADLSVMSIIIEGEHSGDFIIISGKTAFVLAPGSTENIEIKFIPETTGIKNASMTITSDDSDEGTISVSLTGTGILKYLESPYLVNCYPPAGAVSIPVSSGIQFKIKDDNEGVDISTLNVYINTCLIISGGADLTGGNACIKSCGKDYAISYDPGSGLPEDTTIIIRVRCNDLAPEEYSVDSTYSFNSASWNVLNLTTGAVGPEGGIVYDDFTGIQIVISESALEDTTLITIDLVNDYPELPENVTGIGFAYHLGPDGLHLNESATISIPYTLEDLENAGVTNPMDIPVFYFSTSTGEWINLEVIDYDDDYLYVVVDEFCYLVLGASTMVGLEEVITDAKSGKSFILYQNYPNPVVDNTTISFCIPKASYVTLKVYDVNFMETEVLLSRECPAGKYNITWNASRCPSGIYFYQLQTDEFSITKKMVIN
jgi:hypothetical protein